MIAVLDHPRLLYDWFTTALLSFHNEHGLIIYQRWALNFEGGREITPGMLHGATLLLDVYYLAYLMAFIGTLWLMRRWRKDGWLKIKPHVGYDSVIVAIIGTLVGAKLAYVFIYNPDFYFKDPKDTADMLQRLFLNWSGMASHGAVFGIVASMSLYKLVTKAPMLHIGDVGCTAGAAGAMFIRSANFLNGELYGREDVYNLPWSMRFPVSNSKGHSLYVQAERWFEAVPDKDGMARLERTEPYRLGHEFMNITADGTRQFFAPDSVPADLYHASLQVVTSPRHPSQIYQLILEGLLLFLFMVFMRKRVKRVGQLCAIFFIGYPLARIVGEFFRQPDVQFATEANPLGTVAAFFSMGQLLSFGMMLFGIGLLVWSSRKGKLISEMTMWPPDKEKLAKPISHPSYTGDTGAGDLSGVTIGLDGQPTTRIRKALDILRAKEELADDNDQSDDESSSYGRRGQ